MNEPDNIGLRLEASTFFISEFCSLWIHRGNGQYEVQDENRPLLLRAKTHLEFVFNLDNSHLYAVETLLMIAYIMDDCGAGSKYRNIMVNNFQMESDSDFISKIDRWLEICPRGFWGGER